MTIYRVVGHESGVYIPEKLNDWGFWVCISWCYNRRRIHLLPWKWARRISFVWTTKTHNWHSKAEYAWETIRAYDTSKHPSIGTLKYNPYTNKADAWPFAYTDEEIEKEIKGP